MKYVLLFFCSGSLGTSNVIHAALFKKIPRTISFSSGKIAFVKTKCLAAVPVDQKNSPKDLAQPIPHTKKSWCYDNDPIGDGQGIILSREQSEEFARALRDYLDSCALLRLREKAKLNEKAKAEKVS